MPKNIESQLSNPKASNWFDLIDLQKGNPFVAVSASFLGTGINVINILSRGCDALVYDDSFNVGFAKGSIAMATVFGIAVSCKIYIPQKKWRKLSRDVAIGAAVVAINAAILGTSHLCKTT
jgi:hypothetical protein